MDFGQHQTARVTPSQLEELEYFAIDWILELCKPNLRYSLRLQGRDNQYIDVAFRIKKI